MVLATAAAFAADSEWNNGTGNGVWSAGGNWLGGVPASTDTAVFNEAGTAGKQEVEINADTTVAKIVLNANAAGGLTINQANDAVLKLGAGGFEFMPGAGDLEVNADVDVTVNQNWRNNGAGAAVFGKTVSSSVARTLTLENGAFDFDGGLATAQGGATALALVASNTTVRLRGAGTFSGGTTIRNGARIFPMHDAAFGAGAVNLGASTAADPVFLTIGAFPRTLDNRVVVMGASAPRLDGDAPLVLSGDPAGLSMAQAANANTALFILNSAPVTLENAFSLCNSATSVGDASRYGRVGSGADIRYMGGIIDCNGGDTVNTGAQRGWGFGFNGGNGNITIWGSNGFGVRTPTQTYSTQVDVNTHHALAYNTVGIGGPGGAGARITPFGASFLNINTGKGFFIKALVDGQVLDNVINIASSSGNDGAMPMGFESDNGLVMGAEVRGSTSFTFPNMGTGLVTFDEALTYTNGANGRSITLRGPGSYAFSENSMFRRDAAASNPVLVKTGTGTLTLSGTGGHMAGRLELNGGTTILDYTAGNADRLLGGTNATALVLAGADLVLQGGAHAQTLGAGGGTTLNAGHSQIRRSASGASTIALGNITRNAAATLDIPEAGMVHTTSANTASDIVNGVGYATIGGADWATVGPDGFLTNLPASAYSEVFNTNSDLHLLVTNTVSYTSAARNTATIKIAPTAPGQSFTYPGNVITFLRNGILFTGPHDFRMDGAGAMRPNNNDLIFHHHGSGILDVDMQLVINSSSSRIVKTGPGTLRLNHENNTIATVNINGGTLCVATNGNLGATTGTIATTIDNGTLQTTAGFITPRTFALGAGGATFRVDEGTLEITGIVSAPNNYTELNKTGAGTLLLGAANTYVGQTFVNEGTLRLGNTLALGPSILTVSRSTSPVFVRTGATLDIAGFNPAIGCFTLDGGTLADSAGGGTLASYRYNIRAGVVDAVLTDTEVYRYGNSVGNYVDQPSMKVNMYKTTAADAFIESICTFTGNTFVDGGTLYVNGAVGGAAHVRAGGTLAGGGAVGRTVLALDDGVLFASEDANTPATLKVGGGLGIIGGTFKALVTKDGASVVKLTSADARVLLEDATLDLRVKGGVVNGRKITLVKNAGTAPVEGEFNSLPEGSQFDVGSKRFVITYCGGAGGNDIVLENLGIATVLIVR